MATDPGQILSYEDLLAFPEDNVRREIIGGELFVTPAPTLHHQDVVLEIAGRLWLYVKEHGGKAFGAPVDVYLTEHDVVEPDVIFIRPEHSNRLEEKIVRGAPDLVIEVSSPSSRRRDTVTKRALYEEHGVPEYWFVDLESDRVEVYRRDGERYGVPVIFERGATLTSNLLPGLELSVRDVLGEAQA